MFVYERISEILNFMCVRQDSLPVQCALCAAGVGEALPVSWRYRRCFQLIMIRQDVWEGSGVKGV